MLDRQLHREPVALAVLGQVADPGGDRLAWGTQLQLLAVELDPAFADRIGSEHGAGELRASRPDQTREPNDLAGAYVERAVLSMPGRVIPST